MKREIAIGVAVAILALAAVAFAAKQNSDGIASSVTNATLQAMDRGYRCHADGRDIDACKAEQREIWRRVKVGEPYQPFGKN